MPNQRTQAEAQTLREWLAEGPFALAMSSGFFGFFAHTGMLRALTEQGLVPSRLAGSSAGAMVAGVWAAGVDAEAMGERLVSLTREEFWDPSPGLGLLQGQRFEALLEDLLPVHRFEDCRAPLALSVFDVLSRRTRVVEEGALIPAIRASAALPFLFQPVWLDGRPCLDGGILDRPGLLGVRGEPRLLFHHLSTRSPWRRKGSKALVVPKRPGMVSLVIHGLPRVSPFRLDRGREAYRHAYQETLALLDRPHDGVAFPH